MNNEHQCHDHEHIHDGVTHTHEHHHDGNNHNTQEILDGAGSREEKTLKILLAHWIEHNKSHEEGFSEWVGKAKNMGKVETAQFIEKAINFMQQADDMLKEADEHMTL